MKIKEGMLNVSKMSNNKTKSKEEQHVKREFLMHFYENRLKSFENWPFESDCSCVPEKMATAGFYHDPTDQSPDLGRCYVCQKELEGWEPEDDPWEEHRSHSRECEYLKLSAPCDPTIDEFLKIETARQQHKLVKQLNKKITDFETYAASAREEIIKLQNC